VYINIYIYVVVNVEENSNEINQNQINITSLAVFGAGFIMRPLGGIFIGYIGDTLGTVK
jgi:hypothetical protein